ncbi:MAG: ABC transporter permease [Crocinitomicaceae bacterium]
MVFLNSLSSEWLKTKRSAASWLCIIGGFFIPLISMLGFFYQKTSINALPDHIWQKHFNDLWHNMAVFLLPMGLILAASLITQIEYKNNTWKQVHATPQSFTTIFFSKFSVIVLMTMKFFLFFNIGILLSGIIPCLIYDGHWPKEAIPYWGFLKGNGKFLITCLPLLAIQYLISLQFKNFLVPVGIGLMGLIGSLIGMTWSKIFISPYAYSIFIVFPLQRDFNIYAYAIVYFLLIMTAAYLLYYFKREKG